MFLMMTSTVFRTDYSHVFYKEDRLGTTSIDYSNHHALTSTPNFTLVFLSPLIMVRFSLLRLVALTSQFVGLLSYALAQDAPLFIQGGLEGASATDETYNTGGSISLNGFDINVPKNMLVQFPAAWVPWKDFVADKEAMLGYEINVSLQS